MNFKRHIPNAVTLLNLLSGCISVIFAVYGNLVAAAVFVFLGIFFDFFDGLLARKLNVQSPLGPTCPTTHKPLLLLQAVRQARELTKQVLQVHPESHDNK